MPPIDLTLPADIGPMVDQALAEDVGDGDRNAALIDPGVRASASVVVRDGRGTQWMWGVRQGAVRSRPVLHHLGEADICVRAAVARGDSDWFVPRLPLVHRRT